MVTLKVPSADGGEEEGLNDPGVEFFLGRIEHHLARESAQNTIDAAAPGAAPVNLSFDLLSVPRHDIPAADAIAEVLVRCREFWEHNPKSVEFFGAAVKALGQREIKVLRIGDHQTTGLTGGDSERSGRWYGLVRSAGVSNKDEGSGGSYGIGKYAPFAASTLRTVFYSTRTVAGDVAFQGVMRLASHKDSDGRVTRRTGYIGSYSDQAHSCAAVRHSADIPARFVRKVAGTDILVVGYRGENGWEREIVSSILANFWPAIHQNLIAFRVGERVLDSSNLAAALSEFQDDDDFVAHHYYKALLEGRRHETAIPNLGRVTLYLLADGESLPKRVAMTRKTGMIIELKMFRSRRPFSGFLVCADQNGNELLRSLEPPRHDEWNPKRGTRAGAKALNALYDWIRSHIKELNPIPTSQALDVPDLARYLPFDEEADQEGPSQVGGDAGEVEFTPVTRPGEIEVRTVPESKPRILETTNDGGDRGNEGGADEGGGGGGGGEAENDGDDGTGGADGGAGNDQRTSRTPSSKAKLRLRSFRRMDGSYELVVRSVSGNASGFKLVAVGEDGQTNVPPLKCARDAVTGMELSIDGSRITTAVSMRHPARVLAYFDRPLTLALAVEAI